MISMLFMICNRAQKLCFILHHHRHDSYSHVTFPPPLRISIISMMAAANDQGMGIAANVTES